MPRDFSTTIVTTRWLMFYMTLESKSSGKQKQVKHYPDVDTGFAGHLIVHNFPPPLATGDSLEDHNR